MSEVLVTSKVDVTGRALCVRDIHLASDRVVIRLRRSKTDQKGKGKHIYLFIYLFVSFIYRPIAEAPWAV